MIDDILIGGTRLELKKKTIKIFGNTKCFLNFYLGERVQMIHVIHIAPQVSQISRDIEIHEVFSFKKNEKNIPETTKRKRKIIQCYPPATRICCRRGISSQSKQQRVSPVRNRFPRLPKCSSIFLNCDSRAFFEASSFFRSISLNFW